MKTYDAGNGNFLGEMLADVESGIKYDEVEVSNLHGLDMRANARAILLLMDPDYVITEGERLTARKPGI